MKYSIQIFSLAFLCLVFNACIGDDFIDDEIEPTIKISNPVSKIQLGTSYQFEYSYFDNIGQNVTVNDAIWSSTDNNIININSSGSAMALDTGISSIKIEYASPSLTVFDELEIEVTVMPVEDPDISKSGVIKSTSSYVLEGAFGMVTNGDDLKIEFENDYKASTALPGLYVYLSNNPNTISDALEIGRVIVFSGMHSYNVENVNINDYQYLLYFCKPFNVKVGDGIIN